MDILPYILFMILVTISMYTIMYFSKQTIVMQNSISYYRYTLTGSFFLLIVYIVFLFFTSFRVIDLNYGGKDAIAYKYYFSQSVGYLSEALQTNNFEIGYSIMMWLVRTLTSEYTLFLVIIYTLIFYMFTKYILYLPRNIYSLLSILLILSLIINSFNIQRVILAVFIGMIVYITLYKKKFVLSLLLAGVATSIHISAVILFPVIFTYIIYSKKETIKFTRLITYIFLLSLASAIAIKLAITLIIDSKYSIYNNEAGIAFQTYIMIVFVFILSIAKYSKVVALNSFNKTLIIILPVALIIIPLQLQYSILYRMVLYFLPIVYSLVPSLIKAYSVTSIKNIHNFIIQLGLIFILIYKFFIFVTVELESAGLPYKSILFN